MKFDNIIFDLGGVILDIDYDLTTNAFLSYGLEHFDELFSQAKQTSLFDDLETGRITPGEFRNGLRKFVTLSDEQIDRAWNAMLKGIPEGRIDFLSRLSEKHRMFLLSNTNAIHIAIYRNYLEKITGKPTLEPVFEKEYYSHEIALRKPDVEVFRFVIDSNELDPERTLFIDDTLRHVEGAKQAGLNSVLLEKGMTIEELLKDHL